MNAITKEESESFKEVGLTFVSNNIYPRSFNIALGEGYLKIHTDGRVDIPHGIALDEAARAFFTSLQDHGIRFVQEDKDRVIASLRKRIIELEALNSRLEEARGK